MGVGYGAAHKRLVRFKAMTVRLAKDLPLELPRQPLFFPVFRTCPARFPLQQPPSAVYVSRLDQDIGGMECR